MCAEPCERCECGFQFAVFRGGGGDADLAHQSGKIEVIAVDVCELDGFSRADGPELDCHGVEEAVPEVALDDHAGDFVIGEFLFIDC